MMEEIAIKIVVAFLISFIVFFLMRRLITRYTPLSPKTRRRSDKALHGLMDTFRRENKREPTRDETFKLIVNASHHVHKESGWHGHWRRQRIRKRLIEKQGINKEYRMR